MIPACMKALFLSFSLYGLQHISCRVRSVLALDSSFPVGNVGSARCILSRAVGTLPIFRGVQDLELAWYANR